MSEKFQFNQDVIDLAWEDAQAANRAFDDVQKAGGDQRTLESAVAVGSEIDGVNIELQALRTAEGNVSDAKSNFKLLNEKAGLVISKKYDPFSPQETSTEAEHNTIVVPEITEETRGILAALPEKYAELVYDRFAETVIVLTGIPDRIEELRTQDESEAEAEITANRILALLSIQETVPVFDINELVDKIVALTPTYEAFAAKKEWQANLGFVPRGLTTEQWDALLTGYDLPDGSTSNGAYSTYDGNEVTDPYADTVDTEPGSWGVIVYSDTDGPVFRNVSKDGTHGSGAKAAVKELKALPGTTYTDEEQLIAGLSPTRDAYNRMQLHRLMTGRPLLDRETWTIGRENVTVDGVLSSVFLRSDPRNRQVGSDWDDRGNSNAYYGVRPSDER